MNTLGVYLNGEIVGYLTQTQYNPIAFRFADSYRSMFDRPILSQSFEDDLTKTYSGRNQKLPPFFANLIPEEGPLRSLIEHNLKIDSGDDIALLEAVGRDLPGAVEIFRINDDDTSAYHYLDKYLPEDFTNALEREEQGLRFSLAGVQMKFSVIRDAEKITLPAKDQSGEWIVKVGSTRFPFTIENEYAIMQWAKHTGFEVPECYLQNSNTLSDSLKKLAQFGEKVFIIRRYDRKNGLRIHQEDFAQVTNLQPHLKYDHIKYEQCGRLIKAIISDDAYYEFIRRLIFVIASGNADAHLKNWSLLYANSQHPSLAPMYDQVCTIAWPELKSELALNLAGTKNWFALEMKHFEQLGKRAGADPEKTLEVAKDTLSQLVDSWNNAQIASLLPQTHTYQLQKFWDRIPILRSLVKNMKWIT